MKFICSRQAYLAVCFSCLTAFAQNPVVPRPPDTPKQPVSDEYHGVKITDQYRWLEDWNDPSVKQWSAAENARTRAYLDNLPSRSSSRRFSSAAATTAIGWWLPSRMGMAASSSIT
jgi:prolyl oligopeptidase